MVKLVIDRKRFSNFIRFSESKNKGLLYGFL